MRKIAIIGLLLVFSLGIKAQNITIELDTTRHLIADWITITAKIVVPKNSIVLWPKFNMENTGFDTVYLDKIDTINTLQDIQYHQRIVLTCYDTGWQKIPAFEFGIQNGEQITSEWSQTPSIYIATIPIDTTKGLKVIKQPFKLEIAKNKWRLWLILSIIVLTILLVIVYFIKRKPKKISSDIKVVDTPISPYQNALEAFEQLKIEQSWRTKGEKYFYSQIADIVRVYLLEAKNIKTLERTTNQICNDFRQKKYAPERQEELTQLLNLSDKVKFAKAIPEESFHLSIITDGINFINHLNQISND